jgi:hypothetical protein
MDLLPVSTLTLGHFGTVTGSPVSLHANVKSKAVSSPVRSSACTPTGDANASHNPNSRVKLIAVAQPFDAFMLGAMDAAEDCIAVPHAVSDERQPQCEHVGASVWIAHSNGWQLRAEAA